MPERPPYEVSRKSLERYITAHGLHVTFVHDCIEDIIQAAKAEGWDEGVRADHVRAVAHTETLSRANPYRSDHA